MTSPVEIFPYGIAPGGYRLPSATRLGGVTLQVANLDRSIAFYEQVLGLRMVSREDATAVLSPQGAAHALVTLREYPGASPVGRRARLGLFHFAILLPTRADLGRFLRHLADIGARAGASDHFVSEALYLNDPDGLGIEVYADRPRDAWRHEGGELVMATEPLDADAVIATAGASRWTGMPVGTVLGHVHLHVGELNEGTAFYHDALGFDRVVWSYPGALFLSAGGYHHHLGTNTWAPGAGPAAPGDAQLLEWRIEVPLVADVNAAAESAAARGHGVTRDGADAIVKDPWGTAVRFTAIDGT